MNPLRKWILSNKYFIKCSEPKEKKALATHYLLDGGIWKVPMEEYPNFLRLLSTDLQNGLKYYISENRTGVFKFICDLDFYDSAEITNIQEYLVVIQKVISEYYDDQNVIVCGTDPKTVNEQIKTGFHLVWPKIWITVQNAKEIRLKIIEALYNEFGARKSFNSWEDVVDLAVYEDNGLRMVGCRKMVPCKNCKRDTRETCEKCDGTGKIDENRAYKPKLVLGKNVDQGYINAVMNDYYVMLLETSIMNYSSIPETKLCKELPVTIKKKTRTVSVDPLSSKIENFIKKVYKNSHSKIKIKKITKVDEFKYFAEPDDNFCLNVNRNHTSSGIYFQIKPTGVSQRCFCKKLSMEGRVSGYCKNFCSEEIPLSKVLENYLFPSTRSSKKKISNCSFTLATDKLICLNNCKNILFQLENELI
uniref:C962R-like N-terminal AEP domain-containing protein n=1 Tax=viral metagenome TaxID=1070528 RepID=A0A6C0I8K9_9ZZZZ